MNRTTISGLCIALLAAGASTPARGDAIFTVTLNTAPLTTVPGSSAGPFGMAFQLTDGSGTSDGNNTATISNFQYGGGGAAACPAGCTVFGGASGSAVSSIMLTDSSFFSALVETFIPGSTLSFQVDLTTNVDSGAPDLFAFSLLDGSGASFPTLDPTGADTLVTVNIDSANPTVLAYGTDSTRLTAAGAVALSIAAPVIGAPVDPRGTGTRQLHVYRTCTRGPVAAGGQENPRVASGRSRSMRKHLLRALALTGAAERHIPAAFLRARVLTISATGHQSLLL